MRLGLVSPYGNANSSGPTNGSRWFTTIRSIVGGGVASAAAPVAPAAAALAAPTSPAATAAAPFSLDSCRDDEDASDLLRLDHVTGRVEIEMPFCGREPSYNSESLRRQISFLFDEPGLPAQGRNDPVLQDAAWALNWGGTSRAATAA